MGLVKCPDCGRNVSSRTTQCPFCGCPSEYYEEIEPTMGLSDDANLSQTISHDTTRGIINIDNDSEASEMIKVEGLAFPSRFKTVSGLYGELSLKVEGRILEFLSFFESNAKAFDDITGKVIPYLIDEQKEGAILAVGLLMNIGINDITSNMIVDHLSYDSIKEEINYLEDIVRGVDDEKEKRRLDREIWKASGTRWAGGGFSVGGAIKGHIEASAMNMAVDTMRGIGGFFKEISDDSAIAQKKESEYNSVDESELVQSIRDYYRDDLFNCLIDILKDKRVLKRDDFDTSEFDRILTNYRDFYERENSEKNKKRLIDMLIKCIEKNPFDIDCYIDLYEFDPQKRSAYLHIADAFKIGGQCRLMIAEEFYIDKILELVENANETVKSENLETCISQIKDYFIEYDRINKEYSEVLDLGIVSALQIDAEDTLISYFDNFDKSENPEEIGSIIECLKTIRRYVVSKDTTEIALEKFKNKSEEIKYSAVYQLLDSVKKDFSDERELDKYIRDFEKSLNDTGVFADGQIAPELRENPRLIELQKNYDQIRDGFEKSRVGIELLSILSTDKLHSDKTTLTLNYAVNEINRINEILEKKGILRDGRITQAVADISNIDVKTYQRKYDALIGRLKCIAMSDGFEFSSYDAALEHYNACRELTPLKGYKPNTQNGESLEEVIRQIVFCSEYVPALIDAKNALSKTKSEKFDDYKCRIDEKLKRLAKKICSLNGQFEMQFLASCGVPDHLYFEIQAKGKQLSELSIADDEYVMYKSFLNSGEFFNYILVTDKRIILKKGRRDPLIYLDTDSISSIIEDTTDTPYETILINCRDGRSIAISFTGAHSFALKHSKDFDIFVGENQWSADWIGELDSYRSAVDEHGVSDEKHESRVNMDKEENPSKTCIHCGRTIMGYAKFCNYCGKAQ